MDMFEAGQLDLLVRIASVPLRLVWYSIEGFNHSDLFTVLAVALCFPGRERERYGIARRVGINLLIYPR